MDIKALQLEARFSLPPNSLGYCGRESAAEKFKQCIINGECGGIEGEITKFIVLYPYLKTLAGITKLPLFSYEVLESYWIGNDLLKKIKPEDYDLLLKNFEKQGVPDFFVKELKEKPPKVFIPNHLFHVLHVGVGKASGAVPFNLQSINNCMIRWGEVKEIKDQKSKIKNKNQKLKISLTCLKQAGAKYELYEKDEIIKFDRELLFAVKVGDIVAVHWNMIVKILNKREEKNLSFWTKKVLRSLKV